MPKLLFLLLALFVTAQFSPAAVTEPEVKEAIKEFLADPVNSKAQGRIILQFAEESPDHEVELGEKFLPWLEAEQQPENSQLLLVAYIAGNLSEQIKKKTSKSEAYAGVLTLIDVYEKLRSQQAIEPIAQIKQLIDLEAQGTLKAHIEAP